MGFAILFMLGEARAGRDPFLLPEKVCEASSFPFHWRLMGIIGREGARHAWLKPENGKWVQRQPNQPLDETWRISQIEPFSVRLAAQNACLHGKKLVLTGGHDE